MEGSCSDHQWPSIPFQKLIRKLGVFKKWKLFRSRKWPSIPFHKPIRKLGVFKKWKEVVQITYVAEQLLSHTDKETRFIYEMEGSCSDHQWPSIPFQKLIRKLGVFKKWKEVVQIMQVAEHTLSQTDKETRCI